MVLLVDSAQDGQAGQDAEAAVQPAAVRHGIQVTAEDQGLRRVSREGDPVVPGGVLVLFDGQIRQFLPVPAAGLQPGVGPGDSLCAVFVAGQGAELLELGDGLVRVDDVRNGSAPA